MMTATDVRRFVEHALGLGNRGDLDGLARLFDPNVEMVGPEGTLKGSEAVRQGFEVLYTAFPDLHVEINRLIVEDDWLAYTATATGTHRGPLKLSDGRLIPPTPPLAQWGTFGSAPGQFNTPVGIAVDQQGDIYVAEEGGARIQKLFSLGQPLTQWGKDQPPDRNVRVGGSC